MTLTGVPSGGVPTGKIPTGEVPTGGAGARFESRAMGSPLRLSLGRVGSDTTSADRLWSTVVDEFELAEAAMSRFRDASELTALNRAAGRGAVAHPSARLRRALTTADRAHRMTAGRFDPRVLVDLDRLGYRGADLDGTGAADRPDEATRIGAGTGLGAVGGLGSGTGLDRLGARDLLLEAGGDIVARGVDPGGGPWQLGIEDPAGGEDLAVIALSDLAVATSSIGVHRWLAEGRAVHHLLDPRTGEPAEGGLLAVTVAGPDPAWAEVWSKVLFVTGHGAIATEARSRGLAAWWVTDDGRLEMTAAARARTIWVAAEDA